MFWPSQRLHLPRFGHLVLVVCSRPKGGTKPRIIKLSGNRHANLSPCSFATDHWPIGRRLFFLAESSQPPIRLLTSCILISLQLQDHEMEDLGDAPSFALHCQCSQEKNTGKRPPKSPMNFSNSSLPSDC